MALSKDDIRAAAERLDTAEKTRKQIRQLSLEYPRITLEDAYAIQKAWVEMKVAQGRLVKGHKIGLTSKAMQSALNIDEPDSGILLDDMFFADGGLVPTDRFIATRVEAELAFVMKHRAGRDRTARCSTCSTPPTSWCRRWKSWIRGSNASIPRPRQRERSSTPSPTMPPMPASCWAAGRSDPLEADLRWIGALCFRNGQLEETGLAAGVLNHPATAVAWLANKIAPNGLALEAGQIVLAGSFIRPIETRKGDTIQADYGPYGSVSCYFA